jgi:hypothetical protein
VYNSAGVQGAVAILELAGNQGCRQPSTGLLPEHWAQEKSGRGQRLILVGGSCWSCGDRLYRGCEGAPAGVEQKPPRGVREKRFPGIFSVAPAAMVGIPAGLKTRPAWRQLDRLGGWRRAWPPCLGLTVCRSNRWTTRCGVQGGEYLQAAHGDDLFLRPDLEG